MSKRKYIYKHLTTEMMKMLDEEVSKIGKDALYEKILINCYKEDIAKFMQVSDAFKKVAFLGNVVDKYIKDMETTSVIVGGENMPLEQEALYYIDRKRFLFTGMTPYVKIT